MSYFPKNAGDTVLFVFMHLAIAMLLFLVYLLAIVLPIQIWTERECLAAGYPKAEVTVTLDRYCLDLVGGTARVDTLSKVKQAPESSKPSQN